MAIVRFDAARLEAMDCLSHQSPSPIPDHSFNNKQETEADMRRSPVDGLRAPRHWALFALAASLTLGVSSAWAQTLPQFAKDKHLGVPTCSGSTCHGATKPFKDSPVLQNEFVTWHKEDAHSEAYKVLLEDDSKRIARNLGLKEPAHKSDLCLDCHADNIPSSKRGNRFQIADGVNCEACHGGAERWLGPHIAENDHKKNVGLGLYPTEEPAARAALCLSCHFGTKDKFVTHRIMGAGHPRMSFELDTFTAIQPSHYEIDKDYRKRKQVWNGIQTWAIGQTIAANMFLETLADPKMHKSGIFPELVFFDCHACHHKMEDKRWVPGKSSGQGPGVVRLNDANLLMLEQVAKITNPDLANQLGIATKALHRATGKGMDQVSAAAKSLISINKQIAASVNSKRFSDDDMKAVMSSLLTDASKGDYQDYSDAEQAYMAVEAILNALETGGGISAASASGLHDALDGVFNALEDDEAFKPNLFRDKMKAVQARFGK